MKSSKKIILLSISIIILIALFLVIKSLFICNVSDKEAIALAKAFCNKMGVNCSQEPWIFDTDFVLPIKNSKVKMVDFGKNDKDISISISCHNKEVCFFANWKIKKSVFKKYNISSIITNEPRKWPPLLPESKSKEIIFTIANKIGLPSDVEFSKLSLDKYYGYWIGYWTRKHNGFPYELDFIEIKILAIDGEFYVYRKWFFGKPCPTEVKITKEEAIKEGWRQVTRVFTKVDWKNHKDDYRVKSAELKIVQPNVISGQFSSFLSTNSRLAWVLIYGLKEQPDERKLQEVDYMEQMTIKIDAATKEFLGGGRPL
jgi:hypothetical protein